MARSKWHEKPKTAATCEEQLPEYMQERSGHASPLPSAHSKKFVQRLGTRRPSDPTTHTPDPPPYACTGSMRSGGTSTATAAAITMMAGTATPTTLTRAPPPKPSAAARHRPNHQLPRTRLARTRIMQLRECLRLRPCSRALVGTLPSLRGLSHRKRRHGHSLLKRKMAWAKSKFKKYKHHSRCVERQDTPESTIRTQYLQRGARDRAARAESARAAGAAASAETPQAARMTALRRMTACSSPSNARACSRLPQVQHVLLLQAQCVILRGQVPQVQRVGALQPMAQRQA